MIFRKEFNFKHTFLEEGILFTLHDKRGRHIPLHKETDEQLFKHQREKYRLLYHIRKQADNLREVEFTPQLIEEFHYVFSAEDLQQPAFKLTDKGIILAYKTIFALRFSYLGEELGLNRDLMSLLEIPAYDNIVADVKTIGSFTSPEFYFDYSLNKDGINTIHKKKMLGHCLITDKDEKLFLLPSVKMLVARLMQHEELYKSGAIATDLNLRYREFYDIKNTVKNSSAYIDKFTEKAYATFINDLPWLLGREGDGEIILQESLPIEMQQFDKYFQKKMRDIDPHNPPNKLVLVDSEGNKAFVNLSQKAWQTKSKINELTKQGQQKLEEVFANPTAFLDGIDKRDMRGDFSDRVAGFIFGKTEAERSARKSEGWADDHDDYSMLLRSTSGAIVPITSSPTPETYTALKKAMHELEQQIDDTELRKKIAGDAYLTPLPPEQGKTIRVECFNDEFNLHTLANACKRIENENTPQIDENRIEEAKTLVADAEAKGEMILTWNWQQDGEMVKEQIPVQSMKSALPKDKKQTPSNVALKIDESWEQKIDDLAIKNAGKITLYLKEGVKLYPHQEIGYSYLVRLLTNPAKINNDKTRSGMLLADDTGLGKTIQAISLIAYLKANKQYGNKPILVVAPVSLIEGSWIDEGLREFVNDTLIGMSNANYAIKKFSQCPYRYPKKDLLAEAITIDAEIKATGKHLKDCLISNALRQYLDNVKEWCKNDIIFVSYETLRSRSIEFGYINFSLVVLDEAQKIKTHGSLQSNAARALQADMYLAMTATPIENCIMDLYAIMDFVFPFKLGTRDEFREKYSRRLTKASAGSKEREQLKGGLLEELKPLWLRRSKKDVFRVGNDLPRIIHYDSIGEKNQHAVAMSAEQKKIYEDQLGLFQTAKRGQKLDALRKMLEACHSPWLRCGKISWENKNELFGLCPKLQCTFAILEQIYNHSEAEGRKVIIFANVIKLQNSLAWLVKEWAKMEKGVDIEVEVYNGDVPADKRPYILDRFKTNKGFQALVVSPRAGGAGLNIQFANHVIHYTREWNPALEKQATDRVYRIGQKRTVHVYYPTTTAMPNEPECAEEKLANVLTKKRDIMDDFTMSYEEVSLKELCVEDEKDVDNRNVHVGVNNLDSLDNKQFEGFVACMFDKLGYKAKVIGKSGDHGADVVCFGKNKNYLVQVKHTKKQKNTPAKCIDEIRGAKSFYESQYNKEFSLCVVTNCSFQEKVYTIAKMGTPVELWNKDNIAKELDETTFSLAEIEQQLQNK